MESTFTEPNNGPKFKHFLNDEKKYDEYKGKSN